MWIFFFQILYYLLLKHEPECPVLSNILILSLTCLPLPLTIQELLFSIQMIHILHGAVEGDLKLMIRASILVFKSEGPLAENIFLFCFIASLGFYWTQFCKDPLPIAVFFHVFKQKEFSEKTWAIEFTLIVSALMYLFIVHKLKIVFVFGFIFCTMCFDGSFRGVYLLRKIDRSCHGSLAVFEYISFPKLTSLERKLKKSLRVEQLLTINQQRAKCNDAQYTRHDKDILHKQVTADYARLLEITNRHTSLIIEIGSRTRGSQILENGISNK